MNEGKKELLAEAKGEGFLDRDHPLVADLLRRVVDDLADRLRPGPPKPSSRRRRGDLVPLHRGLDGFKLNGGLGGPRARPESQCCTRRPGSA
jgi:hypothetical protein